MEEKSSEINKKSSWVQGGHAAAMSSVAEVQGNPVSSIPLNELWAMCWTRWDYQQTPTKLCASSCSHPLSIIQFLLCK